MIGNEPGPLETPVSGLPANKSSAPGPSAPVQATWSRRDSLVAALLSLATAAFILWQNSHVAILWDLGYLLDTADRIALGQMPYRDFPLVHAPLTFLIQAAIIHLAGRHYWLPIGYAALAGALATLICWRIVLHMLRERVPNSWTVSILLAAPLVFLGIYGIYPHPIYDCDCALAILVSLFLLQRLTRPAQSGWLASLATGAAAVLPLFFKQNMGLPYLLAVTLGTALIAIISPASTPTRPQLLKVLAGIALALVFAVAAIQLTAGLANYLHWTIAFAAQRRLPGLAAMLTVYQQPYFAWMLLPTIPGLILLQLPAARRLSIRIAALCLLAAPFLWTILFLFLNSDPEDRADSLLALWPMLLILSALQAMAGLIRPNPKQNPRQSWTLAHMLPFILLAAIHGTFLSQQLWGSSYAIWPLLILLVATLLSSLPLSARTIALPLAGVISVTLLICGSLYALSHDRLAYVDLASGPVQHASLPALRGISTRGPYLAEFEELVHFAEHNIPFDDALLILPGDEPFYYATGRTPSFPVLLFDSTDDPYSPQQLIAEAHTRNVQWVIVKRHMQLSDDPIPQSEEVHALIGKEFIFYRRLTAYDIYRAH